MATNEINMEKTVVTPPSSPKNLEKIPEEVVVSAPDQPQSNPIEIVGDIIKEIGEISVKISETPSAEIITDGASAAISKVAESTHTTEK